MDTDYLAHVVDDPSELSHCCEEEGLELQGLSLIRKKLQSLSHLSALSGAGSTWWQKRYHIATQHMTRQHVEGYFTLFRAPAFFCVYYGECRQRREGRVFCCWIPLAPPALWKVTKTFSCLFVYSDWSTGTHIWTGQEGRIWKCEEMCGERGCPCVGRYDAWLGSLQLHFGQRGDDGEMWKYEEMLTHNGETGGEIEGYGETQRHNGRYYGETDGETRRYYGETWCYYGERWRYCGETGGEKFWKIGCRPCWTGKGFPPVF